MSEHWYNAKGEAVFEVPMKSKPDRMKKTTLREAREMNLFPSVTTILKVLDKPMLSTWKMEQVTAAAAEYPFDPKVMDYETWHKDVIALAFQKVDDAADIGTTIHNALDLAVAGYYYSPDVTVTLPSDGREVELRTFVEPVLDILSREQIVVTERELRLANPRYGYAGTTDVAYERGKACGIMDYKTRKTKPTTPCVAYDENKMQIAAYAMAHYGYLENIEGMNIIISTTEPGRVEVLRYDWKELYSSFEAFEAACKIWRYQKNYDPRMV